MNETFDGNKNLSGPGEGSAPSAGAASGKPRRMRVDPRSYHGGGNGHATRAMVDFWTFADLLARRWHWIVIGGILGMGMFFELGWMFIQPQYTASTKLLRYETPAESDFLRTTPVTSDTFAGLLLSPDLLHRVGVQVALPIPPEKLVKRLKIEPEMDSDLVKVSASAGTPREAVELANIYSREAVAYTAGLQAQQAGELATEYLKKQVESMDRDIMALHEQFRGMPGSSPLGSKLAEVDKNLSALHEHLAANPRVSALTVQLTQKLQSSLSELSDLTLKYTDAHPLVQQKRAQIAAIEAQLSAASTNVAAPVRASPFVMGPDGKPMLDPDYEVIQARLRALEEARIQMATRQREAELFAQDPPGMARLFAPAELKTVQGNHRRIKVGLLTIFGGGLGATCSLMLMLIVEAFGRRLQTADDVRRITRLPVLTTLGDLSRMRQGMREQWAFRTWTMLQGRLSKSANHGLVCGVTSSSAGEGRSTWIGLLAEAASLTGFRVLTIATRPSAGSNGSGNQLEVGVQPEAADTVEPSLALTTTVLSAPSEVTEQLTRPEASPVVHIPLPGWAWNLDRRKQWRDALHQWSQIDNLVIFVELPPASVPEAVLLGSNLPNLVWLVESGAADAAETRSQLETLRNARCNLIGAVLNRESFKPVRRLFPRWTSSLPLLAMALWLWPVQAQETPDTGGARPDGTGAGTVVAPGDDNSGGVTPPSTEGEPSDATQPRLSFSVVNPAERAAWQQRLTLGPGDVLTFDLYGEPALRVPEVIIAPDGRVSYLEAKDVMASGLTVDELRDRLDQELAKYRRSPHAIIVPVAYRSKKYYVLGQVVQRGVYVLDQPITVIEALARARGIQSGQVDNDTLDLADLRRAFLMRGQKRLPVDFEKLFQGGDLSQNVQIAPGDFLFFPSATVQQVYVLGEVGLPGPVVFRPDTTVVAAIAARGGFTEKAYKSRVVVVRGSLSRPETLVVDVYAALQGRGANFQLQPRDLIYVSWRPFSYGEDLADLAVTAFTQAIVASWVGADILSPNP